MNRADWYARVNDAWPEDVPPLTAEEAVRAVKKLYRFVLKRSWTGKIKVTSGNRYTYIRGGVLQVNPERGWAGESGLVHTLSHSLHYRLDRTKAPHDKSHARLELKMIKEVVKRGWLEGKLKKCN